MYVAAGTLELSGSRVWVKTEDDQKQRQKTGTHLVALATYFFKQQKKHGTGDFFSAYRGYRGDRDTESGGKDGGGGERQQARPESATKD